MSRLLAGLLGQSCDRGAGVHEQPVADRDRGDEVRLLPASQTSFTRTRLWPNINHSWVVYAVATRGRPSAESNTVTSS